MVAALVPLGACAPASLTMTSASPPEGAVLGARLDLAFDHPLDPRALAGVEVRQGRSGVDSELSLVDGGAVLRISLVGIPAPGPVEIVLPETLRGLDGERGVARTLSYVAAPAPANPMQSPRFRLEGARLSR